MSHEGLSAPEIATLLGVSRQTVLHQIQRYEDSGIIGIEDRPRSGAPAKANAEYIAKLKQAVASDRRELGYRDQCVVRVRRPFEATVTLSK